MPEIRFQEKDYFPHQWEFLKSEKPDGGTYAITGLIGGLGSGKTYVFLKKTLLNLFKRTNNTGLSSGLIIYPTYDLADELFIHPFSELLEKMGVPYKYNISKHRFTTAAGNIKVYQLQKPQRIIGAEYTFVGFDEFDVESWKNCDMAFKKAIGRMRGSEDTEIYIVTTPEGFHYSYKIFVVDANDDRLLVHGKTGDNTYLPKNYIKLIESNYDEQMLKAYRDGEFVNISALATYHAFNRSSNVRPTKYDPKIPIHIGFDFNVDPCCCVLWGEYKQKPNIRVFDATSLSHSGEGDLLTERMCETIKQKYPKNDYIAYPDATGASRASSSRFSDISLIRKANFKVMVKHINPLVVNRVNAMNKALQDNMIIDPSCKNLINDLERVVNKQGTREIDKTGDKSLTHLTDALGYSVEWCYPAVKPQLWSVDR